MMRLYKQLHSAAYTVSYELSKSTELAKKMKVLLVTDNHEQNGGAERYFFELKAKLQAIPDLDVFSIGFTDKEKSGADYQTFKGCYHALEKLLWRFCICRSLRKKLQRAIADFNPDVIHIHNIKQFPLTILDAIKDYPVVQTVHDHSIICPTGQNIHRNGEPCKTGFRWQCFWKHQVKFSKLVYALMALSFFKIQRKQKTHIEHFLPVSPTLAQYMQANAFKNTTYIPPFYHAKPAQTITPNPNHFLFAGSLAAHKGIQVLIREFSLAVKQNAKLHLFIAGDGPDQAWVEQEIKRSALQGNITLLGWQTYLDKQYASASALIFPSTGLEGFPLVIIDAMAHARPVIGVNRGTTHWLIDHQVTGWHFDPMKIGDLANKMSHCATHPQEAQTLGSNAYNKLPKLIDNQDSLDKIVTTYQGIRQTNAKESHRNGHHRNLPSTGSFTPDA